MCVCLSHLSPNNEGLDVLAALLFCLHDWQYGCLHEITYGTLRGPMGHFGGLWDTSDVRLTPTLTRDSGSASVDRVDSGGGEVPPASHGEVEATIPIHHLSY